MTSLSRPLLLAFCSVAWAIGGVALPVAAQAPVVSDPPLARPAAAPPQTPLPTIAFDVISFRRTKTYGPQRVDMPPDSDYLQYHGQPLSRILYFAFYYAGDKLSGEPEWVDTERYDFRAKVAGEDLEAWKAMSVQSRRLMVKQVLIDTCHLKFHLNSQTEPAYELVVGPNGPKLTPHVEGESRKFPGAEVVGTDTHWITPVEAYFQRTTMAQLAAALTAHHTLERPVIDKTSLTGMYDFTLPVPYGRLPPEMLDQLDPGSIFAAIQKLGLKLVPTKAILPGIVIDHIDRPPED
ncbi:MAG: TIGR03435 family protein [Acidobacteriota bacterium]|nr:TIGR03435 family protein [Acidobacteriota bacterium]